MKKGFYLALFFTGWLPLNVWATLAPTATFTDSNGTEKTVSSTDPTEKVEGDAPLLVRFTANATDLNPGSTLEWRFRHSGAAGYTNEITRYEENPEFTFTESGQTIATLYERLNNDIVDSVEFHGYIFNRWGQKLFEWTDVSQTWDGTYNGSPCKDGVYFVLVKARGADGKEYNIRRDVNLIRNYNETTSTSSGGM